MKSKELTNQEVIDEMTSKELLYYAAKFIKEVNKRIHEEE